MIHVFHTPAATLARRREQLARRCLVAVGLPVLGVLLWALSTPVIQYHGSADCNFTGVLFEPVKNKDAPMQPLSPAIHELPAPAPAALPVALAECPVPAPETLAMEWEADDAMADEFDTPPDALTASAPPQQMAAAAGQKPQADRGTFTPPAYLHCPQPPYPAHLRQRRASGTVGVSITVAADGAPTEVQITSPSGHPALDSLARRWILQHWRFTPAQQDGRTLAASVRTSITFSLS